MKLRTSFFNGKVLLKNLTRFAPLWVLYTVGEVLGLMAIDLDKEAAQIAADLVKIMGPVSVFHMVYALLVAACIFGDLFDSRMCNGLHAMPMRREGWLLTGLGSGLVFALIPAIVGGGIAMLFLDAQWWMALVWQGSSLLQFVFFFGLAVFSAMCAGKRLGMIAMYTVLNFFSMLVLWVVANLYEPLLPGVVISDYWFGKLCPVVSTVDATYLDYYYDYILGGFFRGFLWDHIVYLLVCAGAGLVFILLAWLLYRRRPLEKAGDFIAFRPLGIFFLVSYTLALGVLLYTFGDWLGWYRDYGFLTVGILIGWFTGWMLLERTIRIFTKKVFAGLAVFLLLFVGSMGLTLMDPLGVAAYVPKTEEIAAANLYLQSDAYYYTDDDGWNGWQITDPEEIGWVQQMHTSMYNTPQGSASGEKRTYFADRIRFAFGKLNTSEESCISTYVCYRLKNGMNVYRTYRVPVSSPVMAELETFFSDPRSVFAVDDYQKVKKNIHSISVYTLGGDKHVELDSDAQMQTLLAAIEADCKAGLMAQHDQFHPSYDYTAGIDINWNDIYKMSQMGEISGYRGEHVVVYGDCVNTLACLEAFGLDLTP